MGKRGQHRDSDTELWERVARSARPLKKTRPAVKAAIPKPAKSLEVEEPLSALAPAAKPVPKPAPIAKGEALDRGTARKLERGHLPVEARLDLHGMRQREAHAALRRFLKSAQGKGYRHVLVITGKGAEADQPRSFYEEEARGVLRQAVPHWLAAPDLAHVVVSFSPAPRRLGGEGALYVRLRKGR
ncbi:Smr/MutS family protein [Methyloceanibacter sp.]|uniref:Smr/MutS family protein n=1 Tax=Methyloceanibacter sp. TaxID=1965321 RepID=UPI002D5CDDDC|nr:Smr/MutS family protein [Methyloceanibacter sp.]HZP10445.1 Smr/MutS family protein [Methyloceanibacter sp.]